MESREIDKAQLLAHVAAKPERPALHCLHVTNEHIESTDGKLIMRTSWPVKSAPWGRPVDVLVPASSAEAAGKALNGGRCTMGVTDDDQVTVKSRVAGRETSLALVVEQDLKYPDASVIEPEFGERTVSLSVPLLRRVLAAASKLKADVIDLDVEEKEVQGRKGAFGMVSFALRKGKATGHGVDVAPGDLAVGGIMPLFPSRGGE